MHRSGTSVITRGLAVLGVALGRNLLPAQADNIKGFWEDKGIVEINTALMNSCGQDWYTFGALDVSQQDELMQQARDYIRGAVKDVAVWGFKDPRTARLLPFWNSVFSSLEITPSYCLVMRHPLSVAKSLQMRNGLTLLGSSLLWYQYSMDMLDGLGDGLFTLVDYDEFLENPRIELERIAKGLKLKEDVSEHEYTEFCDKYLTPGLRHSRYGLNNLSDTDGIPEEVADLYRYLLELKKQEKSCISADLRQRVAEWKERQKTCRNLFGLINERGAVEQQLHSCEQRLNIAVGHVEQTLKERDAVIKERDSVTAAAEIHKQHHQMVVANLQQTQERTQEEMEEIRKHLEEQTGQLKEQTRQLYELHNSTSWKITTPLRAVVELLKAVAGLLVRRK